MVIFLFIPLLRVRSTNRMGKAGQMGSMVENRSAHVKGFSGENRMGGRGMYLSGTGYELVDIFIGYGDELSFSTKLSKYLRNSFKEGLFPGR
jgi:hypothetical protein